MSKCIKALVAFLFSLGLETGSLHVDLANLELAI